MVKPPSIKFRDPPTRPPPRYYVHGIHVNSASGQGKDELVHSLHGDHYWC